MLIVRASFVFSACGLGVLQKPASLAYAAGWEQKFGLRLTAHIHFASQSTPSRQHGSVGLKGRTSLAQANGLGLGSEKAISGGL